MNPEGEPPNEVPKQAASDVPTDAHPWVGTPQHYHWLRGIVAAVLVLNAIDAVLTVLWVTNGLADEANPVLGDLVARHPVWFAAAKLALVSLGTWVLWRRRREPLAVVAIFIAFLAYYVLLLVHLRALRIALLAPWLGG